MPPRVDELTHLLVTVRVYACVRPYTQVLFNVCDYYSIYEPGAAINLHSNSRARHHCTLPGPRAAHPSSSYRMGSLSPLKGARYVSLHSEIVTSLPESSDTEVDLRQSGGPRIPRTVLAPVESLHSESAF